MKNRIVALGIVALLFSLPLLFSGAAEAEKAPGLAICPPIEISHQQDVVAPEEMPLPCGILQHKTAFAEGPQVIRKFPAAIGVLFMLSRQKTKGNSFSSLAADSLVSFSKDRPVSFHCLRI